MVRKNYTICVDIIEENKFNLSCLKFVYLYFASFSLSDDRLNKLHSLSLVLPTLTSLMISVSSQNLKNDKGSVKSSLKLADLESAKPLVSFRSPRDISLSNEIVRFVERLRKRLLIPIRVF